jgi:hypothetical protein
MLSMFFLILGLESCLLLCVFSSIKLANLSSTLSSLLNQLMTDLYDLVLLLNAELSGEL